MTPTSLLHPEAFLSPLVIDEAVHRALDEDLGRAGDVTSIATIPPGTPCRTVLVARRAGTIAGLPLVAACFRKLAPEHVADGGDDGRVDEGLEGALAIADGRVGVGLGEVVAGGEDHCAGSRRAGAVERDVALVEKLVEAAGDGGVEERVLVGVVVVEGGAVDGGGFGDVVDGDLVESLCLHEAGESFVEELASAADPRIAYFTV